MALQSKNNRVIVNDFAEHIMKSTNVKRFRKTHRKYINTVGDKKYIVIDDALTILKSSNKIFCKNLVLEIEKVETDKKNCINIDKNIFQINGKNTTCIFDTSKKEKTIWVKAKDVAVILGYSKTIEVIGTKVSPENKISCEKLLETFGHPKDWVSKCPDKKTIFINLSGVMDLVYFSSKPIAMKIKQWISNEVIPALYLHGSYSLQPQTIDLPCVKKLDRILDKKTIYVGYIGIINNEHRFTPIL